MEMRQKWSVLKEASNDRLPMRLSRAGSENSDHLLSGNSGHLPVALPGQTIVGDSISGEGKDDRHAQATRGTGASAGGAHVEGNRALSGVSVRTVRRIAAETAITAIDNAPGRVSSHQR